MALFPSWIALVGVLVLLGAAVVGIVVLSRSLTPDEAGLGVGTVSGVERLGPWLAQERTRLFAAALLGVIAAAGAIAAAARFGWWSGVFVAGSAGAVGTLLAVILMPVPAVDASVADPTDPGATASTWRTRGVLWRLRVTIACAVVSVAAAAAAATVAVRATGGGWAMPFRPVQMIEQSDQGPARVEYGEGYLRPWLGWTDAVLMLVLGVAVVVLLVAALRRLGPDVALGGAQGVHELRRLIVVDVITGGMLAQVGIIGFVLGMQLASLTDVDPLPTPGGWISTVAVQPQATIGVVAAVIGVVALIVAVVQLVLAGLGLTRLAPELTAR